MVINGGPQEAVFPSIPTFSFDKLLFLSCLSESLCRDLRYSGHYQGTDSFLVETCLLYFLSLTQSAFSDFLGYFSI